MNYGNTVLNILSALLLLFCEFVFCLFACAKLVEVLIIQNIIQQQNINLSVL
ncbi:hypothetical protein KORDIASMS9_00269 [Kordia sp. SMS9]|nr:hypothetical protein KORDIASMS9_00269 [Kordia sp. SMS9]